MKTSHILFVLVSIIATTLAWRSQSSSGSSGIQIGERGPKRIGNSGDKERFKQNEKKEETTTQQHFNIG